MTEPREHDARPHESADRTQAHPTRESPTAPASGDGTHDAESRHHETSAVEARGDDARETRIVTTDPSLDQHQRAGVSGATWIALILGTLILILLLIFILQNNVPADFAYFGWAFSLPLGIAMLFAAIAGVLITALLGSVRLFKVTRRMHKLERERDSIKRALG